MALRADRDGFLVGGEKEDLSTLAKVLAVMRDIRGDTQEIAALMKGKRSGRIGAQNQSPAAEARAAQSSQQVKTATVVPIRPDGRIPADAFRQEAANAATARRPATSRPGAQRDAKGRFIAAPGKAARPMRKSEERNNAKPDEDSDDNGGGSRRDRSDSFAAKAAAAIADALKSGTGTAAQGAEQIDPVLGAAKELSDIAAPITGVAKAVGATGVGVFQDRRERRKRRLDANETAKATLKEEIPWYRKILKALSGVGGDSDGGFLSAITGSLTGILATAGGALALAAKAFTPLAAIVGALKGLNTSTEDYADRMGATAGESWWKDLGIRTVGVLSDVGNVITLGQADRLGNLMSGGGYNPSTTGTPGTGNVAEPKTGVPAAGQNQLLDLIGKEGGAAGYDAVWSGSKVQPGKPVSQMTIGEVRQWQSDTLADQKARGLPAGRRSSAAGRYQFMSGTLAEEMKRAGLTDADKFDSANQDKLAMSLLNSSKSSGLDAWRSGKATDKQFADHVASKWALFKDSSGKGQYDQGGFNKATIGSDAVLQAAKATYGAGTAPGAATPAVPMAPPPSPLTAAPTVPASASQSGAARSTAVPSPAQMDLPKAPSIPQPIGSNTKGKDAVEVIMRDTAGQNVADRGIANLATGGMGGGTRGLG